MLVINYNGNKPTTDYFKFSVQGNNNADVVRFCLEKKQGKIDLSGYKVYVQAYCEEDDFIDKVEITDNVNIVDNQLSADWTLLKKHTVNRQLLVSLSFEDLDNEVVWQTQIIKITIANGIDADEEMINKYPTVIEEMQNEINELKYASKNKNFVKFITNTTIYFEEDCGVLLTENVRKKSKLVRANYIDKKQGNRLTEIVIPKGEYRVLELLATIFETNINTTMSVQNVNSAISSAEIGGWKIDENKNYGKTFYCINKADILDWEYSLKIKNIQKIGKRIGVIKLQFKFVKDFEIATHKNVWYWKGTMANVYLECIVFIFKEVNLPAYVTAQIKRF